jgi:hypothetical protein
MLSFLKRDSFGLPIIILHIIIRVYKLLVNKDLKVSFVIGCKFLANDSVACDYFPFDYKASAEY